MAESSRLQIAMQVADTVRKYYQDTDSNNDDDAAASSSNYADPLLPLRDFLETPGVQQGIFASAICLAFCLPTRRFLLKNVVDRRLGAFPDLVLTPVIAIGTVQAGLFVGSLYGSKEYLNRFADDAVVVGPELQRLRNKQVCDSEIVKRVSGTFSNNDMSSSYNPMQQTIDALDRALKSCRRE